MARGCCLAHLAFISGACGQSADDSAFGSKRRASRYRAGTLIKGRMILAKHLSEPARIGNVQRNLGLAELEQFFVAIGKDDAHKKWGKELESHVVSGSAIWTIHRVL
jgi:hypothetical protein